MSLNLLDYRVTDTAAAFAKTRDVATAYGVEVKGSELIGLAPAGAMGG